MKRGYISVATMRQGLFKIGEVSKQLQTTPRTLRYYEKFGLLPTTKRTRGRLRLYTETDLAIFKQIKALRDSGKSLAEIKDTINLPGKKLAKTETLILVDSVFSLSPEEVYAEQAELVPMTITFGCYTYKDPFSLAPDKFVSIETKKRVLAQSSPPTVEEYVKIFTESMQKGAEKIISLHPDARITGSYDNALQAAKLLKNLPIDVVDTKLLALGFQLFWEQMIKQKAKDLAKLKKILQEVQNKCLEYIVVGSPERFLQNSSTGMGKLILDFVPVLRHSAAQGLVPIARCKDVTEALKFIKAEPKKVTWPRVGYSSQEYFTKYRKALAVFKFKHFTQYSSVIMANLGRQILGVLASK